MTTSNTTLTARIFGSDDTLRWSCRAGEYLLWVGTDSFLTSDRSSGWTTRDFWQMRDGDFVTITNRWADLPAWFELHPLEVADRAALEMMKRLDAGYKQREIMDGPNLWRMKAGDRLVWVTNRDRSQPVREILELKACVLAIADNASPSSDFDAVFRALQGTELPASDAAAMRVGFDAATALGAPRIFATEWRFGA